MIIAYPKYFVMPVIMDDDFDLNFVYSRSNELVELNASGNEKGEFDDIDSEFVIAQTRQ